MKNKDFIFDFTSNDRDNDFQFHLTYHKQFNCYHLLTKILKLIRINAYNNQNTNNFISKELYLELKPELINDTYMKFNCIFNLEKYEFNNDLVNMLILFLFPSFIYKNNDELFIIEYVKSIEKPDELEYKKSESEKEMPFDKMEVFSITFQLSKYQYYYIKSSDQYL